MAGSGVNGGAAARAAALRARLAAVAQSDACDALLRREPDPSSEHPGG